MGSAELHNRDGNGLFGKDITIYNALKYYETVFKNKNLKNRKRDLLTVYCNI